LFPFITFDESNRRNFTAKIGKLNFLGVEAGLFHFKKGWLASGPFVIEKNWLAGVVAWRAQNIRPCLIFSLVHILPCLENILCAPKN
jgi:hypothetical protein